MSKMRMLKHLAFTVPHCIEQYFAVVFETSFKTLGGFWDELWYLGYLGFLALIPWCSPLYPAVACLSPHAHTEKQKKYWTNLTLKYWNNLPLKYWTNLTLKYWTILTLKYWTNLTLKYWTNLTLKYWTNLTLKYWTKLALTNYTEMQKKYWTILTLPWNCGFKHSIVYYPWSDCITPTKYREF